MSFPRDIKELLVHAITGLRVKYLLFITSLKKYFHHDDRRNVVSLEIIFRILFYRSRVFFSWLPSSVRRDCFFIFFFIFFRGKSYSSSTASSSIQVILKRLYPPLERLRRLYFSLFGLLFFNFREILQALHEYPRVFVAANKIYGNPFS